uniref:ribose-phosphate diphosphokinase n=1 Tax=Blastobotrys adeninivorans TaxID=409370 RepID=A0A060TCG5_BLAAD
MGFQSNSIKILSGNSHPELARLVARKLDTNVANIRATQFSSSETSVTVGESVRDEDVYIIQTGIGSVNDYLMEMLIMAHACRTASARRITAIIPNFPYGRQDKKDKGRAPIAARLLANMLQSSGFDHLVTMDLHAQQIQGFFDIPADNLYAEPSILEYIKDNIADYYSQAVVVSPDAGGAKRAAGIADRLDLPFALIHKERQQANEVFQMILVGDVMNRLAIIIDDMADTCGTLIKAAETVKAHGATDVIAIVTHGIFSGKAIEKLNRCSALSKVVCTNTVPLNETATTTTNKLEVIDISGTIAEAIRRLHNGESISYLFHHKPLDLVHSA